LQNRDKLIQEVAKELGVPQRKVLEVVSSQTGLVRKAMQSKESTSVYLRQVGTFVSKPVRASITKQKIAASQSKQAKKKLITEEPTEFL
jgi:nucleoid DNA-binding protein